MSKPNLIKYTKIILILSFATIAILSIVFFLDRKTESPGLKIKDKLEVASTEDLSSLGFPGQRKMATDKRGNIYVAYRAKYNGYYEIFVAKISQQGSELLVENTNRPIAEVASFFSQRVPSIAVDSNDQVHIVWYGSDNKSENNRQVKYSKSGNQGATWSEFKDIDTIEGVENQELWQEHPTISVGSQNRLYVVWEGKDIENNFQQIKFSKSEDGGDTWTKAVNIKRSKGATQSRPLILEDNGGLLHVLMYSSLGSSNNKIWHSFSEDQGRTWTDWQNISQFLKDSKHISAAESNGSVYAVWRAIGEDHENSLIYFSYFNNYRWSDPVKVDSSKRQQFFPSIGILENDGILIAWMESEEKFGLPEENPAQGVIYSTIFSKKNGFLKSEKITSGKNSLYPNLLEKNPAGPAYIVYEKGEDGQYDIILQNIFKDKVTSIK